MADQDQGNTYTYIPQPGGGARYVPWAQPAPAPAPQYYYYPYPYAQPAPPAEDGNTYTYIPASGAYHQQYAQTRSKVSDPGKIPPLEELRFWRHSDPGHQPSDEEIPSLSDLINRDRQPRHRPEQLPSDTSEPVTVIIRENQKTESSEGTVIHRPEYTPQLSARNQAPPEIVEVNDAAAAAENITPQKKTPSVPSHSTTIKTRAPPVEPRHKPHYLRFRPYDIHNELVPLDGIQLDIQDIPMYLNILYQYHFPQYPKPEAQAPVHVICLVLMDQQGLPTNGYYYGPTYWNPPQTVPNPDDYHHYYPPTQYVYVNASGPYPSEHGRIVEMHDLHTHPLSQTVLLAPQPTTAEIPHTRQWFGRTKAEVDQDNAVLAARHNATQPMQAEPRDVKEGQVFWVVEIDGTRTLRTKPDIDSVCKPGQWQWDPTQHYPYFVRSPKP